MNWIEELYRPWWAAHGAASSAPQAPLRAPRRWIRDIYAPWRSALPVNHSAPALPEGF